MLDRDLIYVKNMLDAVEDIESFVAGYTENSFIGDKKTFNATIRMFELMGEATKRLSPEFKVEQRYSMEKNSRVKGCIDP